MRRLSILLFLVPAGLSAQAVPFRVTLPDSSVVTGTTQTTVVTKTVVFIDSAVRPVPVVVTPPRFPVGPFDLFPSPSGPAAPGFTGTVSYARPSSIVALLASLKANGVRAILKMTGDNHCTYTTPGCDPSGKPLAGARFDFQKWKTATQQYLPMKAAIEQAVADGTLLGYSMIDEPNHTDWGGVLTKATLDSMAAFVKSLFPTLATGAVIPYSWKPDQTYRVLDFIIAQTWKPTISPDSFRVAAVSAAKKNGIALVLSLNLAGMAVTPTCEKRNATECYMSPTEIRSWGTTFGAEPAVCGLVMWKYLDSVFSDAAKRRAIQDVAALVSRRPAQSCRRP